MPSCSVVGVKAFMTVPVRPRPKYVIGSDGSPLTILICRRRVTKRWVIRRKAEVIAAVRGGLLSIEEACSRMLTVNYSRGNPHSRSTASLDYAQRVSSNIGCNGGLDRLRRHSEFSYVASRSEDIDL